MGLITGKIPEPEGFVTREEKEKLDKKLEQYRDEQQEREEQERQKQKEQSEALWNDLQAELTKQQPDDRENFFYSALADVHDTMHEWIAQRMEKQEPAAYA